MTIKPDKKSIASSIFKQNKHVHLEQDKENTVSLTEMQTAIHKLQPQDLEFPIPEKTTSSNIGNYGPKEDMIEDRSGTTFHSCPNNIYHQLFETIQTNLMDQKYQYLIIQLKTYRLNDIQWTEFKSILNAHINSFTDDQGVKFNIYFLMID